MIVTRLLCLAVFLAALADASGEISQAISTEAVSNSRASLRQRRVGNQRRLFYWGNLLYKLHICKDSSGLCPKMHCDGPLKPRECKNHGNGNDGSSSSGGGSSASYSSYSGGDNGGGSAYYTSYQEGEDQYAYEDGDGADTSNMNIGDGTSVSSEGGVQRHFSAFWAVVGGAAVASLVGVFLMKKNPNLEGDEIDHELSQSVSRRLESLLQGKNVAPILGGAAAGAAGTAFVQSRSDAAVTLPKDQHLHDEPDEEAIEMKLDDAADSYVKM